ncbi:aspartate/glutamate racemase family protein [Burkholderia sp. LMG 13014]|uniref:aspartate/glutamate racemase family protein n=1 Tax=Burkholderia sp. LMG 13014 TaxID=2709306 RepID=UPI00196342F6|nr:amino acid racemase [Burkholderia sp. LMG 13014]
MSNDPIADDLVIGVLGGMGPQATVDFLAKLVAATPVAHEQEHLRVRVDSNPKVPDRNKAIAGLGDSSGPVLAEMASGLQRAGADFLVMACNTAHAFEPTIRAAVTVPFVSMVAEACDACERAFPQARRVGVLAAQGCLDARLYQDELVRREREALVLAPPDQRRFMALLYRIKQGDLAPDVHADMRALGETLIAAGAHVIIAACTEVPLVLQEGDLTRPVVDATSNLAQRCVLYARHLEPLPSSSFPNP